MQIVSRKSSWLLTVALWLVSSWAIALDSDGKGNWTAIQVDRYTANGNKFGGNLLGVKRETGDLYKDGTFLPFSVLESTQIRVDEATLSAFSGHFVMSLALWTNFNGAQKPLGNNNAMRYFPRSAETYSIDSVPYVIVTPGGGENPPSAGKPTVTLSVVQASASETGPSTGRFLVALDSARGKDVKVACAISGKAKNGKDYTKIAKNVLIPAGNVSAFLDIIPIDDNIQENAESVKLKVQKRPSYKLGGAKSATVEILDND